MLPDFERKLLRILYNVMSRHRGAPTADELERLTGRDRNAMKSALDQLAEERYIEWEPGKLVTLRILEAWERQLVPQRDAFEDWPD